MYLHLQKALGAHLTFWFSSEKKRAKTAEQPTPPIQEETEPISNVLQGDDILALAIKREDLKKQHIPRLTETQDRPVITQKFIIRKLKPKDPRRKVCHLVAHPANPDAATKPLDYSGPGDNFDSSDQILPHHILGSLQDFKRIAVARGNTQLAELIQTQPCLMTFITAKEEPKQRAPKEKKRPPWAPPPQHNFLKNWQHHLTLRKKQQEALSEHLKKPVGELLMHTGETYRRIQEERELINRTLPRQRDGNDTIGFWSPLECLGDEMTGLIMTKTKTQCGLMEPITRIRKPHSIQVETGLRAKKDAWYRYTWDRSLFLIYRRKELQSIMADLDFSQQDIDGLEVVGRGQPFSSVSVEDCTIFEKSQESSSEDKEELLTSYPDTASMPILGPSLLFCGKPAFWIRGSNPEGKRNVGIGARLTFETLEGEKTSSDLTVVNNGTVAIWYDWRRQPQLDSFQSLKRNRTQRFYFNNREGVILPGETKNFTFFFKSSKAGIFRESWEFGTHPTLLGGALLQVNLYAVSLAQDIFKDDRILLENKLAAREAVTIVQSVVQELLRGISTPERMLSPVDAYLTEEDLFQHRHPQLHYQHQVVQNLHQLWHQYMILPLKTQEAQLSQEKPQGSRTPGVMVPSVYMGKTSTNADQLAWQEHVTQTEGRDLFLSQKFAVEPKNSPRKSIMEEILVEESPDVDSAKSPSEPLPEWNLCLEDFRQAVMTLPEEPQREDALIQLNEAALELCQEQRPLQSDLLHQMCLQLWRDMIDSLKETVYLDIPEEQDQKSSPITEIKVPAGKVGREERKGASQEKKQLGARDKEDKKGAKMPGKEDRVNSKKQKAKDDKKVMKTSSRDRLSSEDPSASYPTAPTQEPMDPLVMEKYTQRLHTEVKGRVSQSSLPHICLIHSTYPTTMCLRCQ
uniref:MYCBP-associated protein n=1 Tax=Castor canadensis TaxID=51338 RepID=A0A8C0WJD6_CASCN